MSWYWRTAGPQSNMTCVLLRRGNLGTYTHTLEEGDHHVKMKAEIGDMLLQAKELKDCQQTPETRWEAWNWFSGTDRWKKTPCWHPDLGSQSPELWGLCFKPSSVWTLRWWPEQTNSVDIHNIFTNKLSCHSVLFVRARISSPTSEEPPIPNPWVVWFAIVVGMWGSSQDWGRQSASQSQKAEFPNFVRQPWIHFSSAKPQIPKRNVIWFSLASFQYRCRYNLIIVPCFPSAIKNGLHYSSEWVCFIMLQSMVQ